MTPSALLVTMEPPAPDRTGGGTHSYVHAVELMRRGWHVTVFVEMATADNEHRMDELGQLGIEVHAGRRGEESGDRWSDRLPDLIEAEQFELAIVQSFLLGERYGQTIRGRSPGTRLIVDMGDLFLLRLARSRFSQRAAPGGLSFEDGAAFARELNAYAASDAVFAVSDKERRLVDLLCNRPGLAAVVPLSRGLREGPAPPFGERAGVLFVGGFLHPPNAEAVRFFCREVWPLVPEDVRRAHPFSVVGFGLNAQFAAEIDATPHAAAIGWVPSLAPYLDRARLFAAPLLTGAGVKNKLLDAFAAGLPVISTTVGVEGIDVVCGQTTEVADGASAFAERLVQLLGDEARWATLADGGRDLMRRAHDPAMTAAAFWATVERVLAGEPRIGAWASGDPG